jgi:RimJ/RimL family protein N-acetyltransferase
MAYSRTVTLAATWDDLRVAVPTPAEVAAAAPRLAAFYNDPHNASMLAHDEDLSVEDVLEHYDSLREDGLPFLLHAGGVLAGDGDLRDIENGVAETAILVGDRGAQGKGLGTRFLTMIHALAFGPVGLHRVYATIIPGNAASLRLFEKIGYARDGSPAARAYIDEDDDVTLSLGREDFLARHRSSLSAIRLSGSPMGF